MEGSTQTQEVTLPLTFFFFLNNKKSNLYDQPLGIQAANLATVGPFIQGKYKIWCLKRFNHKEDTKTYK